LLAKNPPNKHPKPQKLKIFNLKSIPANHNTSKLTSKPRTPNPKLSPPPLSFYYTTEHKKHVCPIFILKNKAKS
jgi:hypothetical protein